MGSDVLAGLSEAQAAVVRDPAQLLAVVAGPGAGKTRVLTRRIAWRCHSRAASADHTLVLTFSRRAAGELRSRLAASGLPAHRGGGLVAGTFHAVAWAQLSRHRADRGLAPLGLLVRPGAIARPALAAALGRATGPGEVRAFLEEVAWARRRGATPASYADRASAAGRWPPWPLDAVARAWAGYTDAKRRRLVIDLDDLLDTAAAMIEDDPSTAAAVRWRHRHLYVDEYQDLNPMHLRLLRAWAGERRDLFLVGDPHQAVYGFNGACPELFARVRQDWPGIRVAHLSEDFRSTPELVAVTEALRRPDAARVSRRAPGAVPTLAGFADEEAEVRAIARAVWEHHSAGSGWGHMAVLARTNARLGVIAAALADAGVPWRLRDRRPLSERPAVEEWLGGLPDSAPPPDVDPCAEDPDLNALQAALEEYRGQVQRATVGGFRAWLDASGPAEDGDHAPGVDLVTFHRAKGLEWDAVWVAGVEEGLVPLPAGAATDAGLAEERRLLYVALTRAARELTVSWAGERSRWVGALADATGELSRRLEGADLRHRLAALRDELSRGGGVSGGGARDGGARAPEPLGGPGNGRVARRRAALTAWRGTRARAAAVPPEVVLPDRVIVALASSTAGTPEEVVASAPDGGRRVSTWATEIAAALALDRTG